MRLTEVLTIENIKVPLQATNKLDAIRELVDLLGANQLLNDPAKVLEAVLERESTRTTGIGYGLAIPHGKTSGADQLAIAVGRCSTPIDFQSIDGKPVSVIWLLTSPPDRTGQHINALSKISKLMTIDRFRAELLRAPDAQSMFDLISQQELDM